jgi:hypothetical protein
LKTLKFYKYSISQPNTLSDNLKKEKLMPLGKVKNKKLKVFVGLQKVV